MKLNVVTYNILAKLLCTEDNFALPNYNPNDVLYANRYMRMWANLEPHIEVGSVICLQEVDVQTSGQLQIDFKKRNYDLYFHAYGMPHNGYMGVAIALPSNLKVVGVDKFRLADGKEWPRIQNKTPFGSKFLKLVTGGYLDFTPKNYTNWFKSKSRWNFMITLEIEYGLNKKLFVSTVHMPCAYRYPATMLTYTALTMEHIQKLAGNNPFVLAGDFNITPNTNLYNLLTTGHCDETSLDSDFPPEDEWRPKFLELKPMKSAINALYGEEPEWTNYCLNSVFGSTEPFRNTLDYIFVSDHFTVTNAFREADEDKLCPNSREPSDHVLVWASLEYNE